MELEEYWGHKVDLRYRVNEHEQVIELAVNHWQISDVTPLGKLRQLKILYLAENDYIEDISPLKELKELESLNLSFNRITNISAISNLKNLKYLIFKRNKIHDISPLNTLKNLIYLNLSDNLIVDIEPLIDLKRLFSLDLTKNRIVSISKSFLENNCGKCFYSSSNDLRNEPDFLAFLLQSKLPEYENGSVRIHLGDNPLKSPPIHIVEQGREAMLEWWERKEKEGTRPLNEVRVIFLGWGNAGKTSVMRRVLGEIPTQGEEDSTQGINLVNWQLATDNGENIKVNLWDFGGQEMQHHTHQFFLAEECIYVVVINNREHDEPRYWLEYIRTMAREAPTILLFNKADEAINSRHNVAELQQEYPFIKNVFEIIASQPKRSLRSQEVVYFEDNVAAFCRALQLQIKAHSFVTTEQYPQTTFTIKEWIEEETLLGKNHISKKAFRLFCESKEVSRIEQDSWLSVFKKIGIITYVEKNIHLDSFLLLNPEWITFAVYRILLHPKTKALQGIITKSDLAELLYQDEDNLDSFRHKYVYDEEDYGTIIELMKEYKLCYTYDNFTIYIPAAFSNHYNSPLNDRVDGLEFTIWFKKFLPPSIVNTLIVNLTTQGKIRKSWASGMEVADNELQTQALVRFKNFEREIHIKAFGERPRELMTLLRHELKNIIHTFSSTLELEERVPIPNKKNRWALYETLIKLEAKSKLFYQDQDGDDHSVKLLLENIETPQQTQHSLSQPFTHRHEFSFSFRFAQVQPQLEAIREGLEELLPQLKTDRQWRADLLEAIQELNEIRDSPTLPIHKSWSIRKIFEGMKNGKDVVDIITLAPDFAEKWVKLQALYDSIKHSLDW